MLHVVANLIRIFLISRQPVPLSTLPKCLRYFCGQKWCTRLFFCRVPHFILVIQFNIILQSTPHVFQVTATNIKKKKIIKIAGFNEKYKRTGRCRHPKRHLGFISNIDLPQRVDNGQNNTDVMNMSMSWVIKQPSVLSCVQRCLSTAVHNVQYTIISFMGKN